MPSSKSRLWAALGCISALIACSSQGDASGADGGAPSGSGGAGGNTGASGANAGGATAGAGTGAAPSGSGGANGAGTGGNATGAATATGNAGHGSGGGSGGSAAGPGSGGADAGGDGGCGQVGDVSLDDANTGMGQDQFAFAGSWAVAMAPEKYDGDDHYSSAAGDTVTLTFAGTSAALHSAKAPHHGIAEVTVDGGATTNVDLYAANRADDVEVWRSGPLASGGHTLRIRVSGNKNAASSGTTVSVDRVVVERTACPSGGGGASGGSNSGGSNSGGSHAGGSSASGGSNSGGNVQRPSYNTGSGFFVVGNKLYDPKGAEFRVRGVNKLHWDASSSGIPKTHANTERWVIDFNQSTATNLKLLQGSIDNHIVPMPGNWDGTCKEDANTLSSIVDTWVAQASAWKTYDARMILNIANEWGPSGTVWRDSYITAIGRLRAAGYLCTISVTSGGCGQNNDDLVNYAAAVLASDPQKNVIFDQHVYGAWGDGQNGTTDLKTGLDKLAATGLAIIVGEFGPGRNIGPSPTTLTPGQIIQGCEARGFGWLAWAWDDPASNADDTWFALSKNGDYNGSADLTTFGKDVVENTSYGLLALARPNTSF